MDALARVHSAPAFRELGYWLFRYRRTWRGSIVISVANPLLFLTALGIGLGKLVAVHALGHVLPDRAIAVLAAAGGLGHTAVARRRPVPHRRPRHRHAAPHADPHGLPERDGGHRPARRPP
jgi:hypothetical protein